MMFTACDHEVQVFLQVRLLTDELTHQLFATVNGRLA